MARRLIYESRKQAPLSEAAFIVVLVFVALIGLLLFNTNSWQRYLILGACLVALLLILAVIGLVASYRAKKKCELSRALAISQIDSLSGIEFENYIAAIFKYKGYNVRETPRSGDFGVDLIITKDGQKTAVQIKRYKKSVNQDAVRQVVAGNAMSYYKAEKTMVVTNSYFTKSVYELAKAHECKLVDRDKLAVWIKDFQS